MTTTDDRRRDEPPAPNCRDWLSGRGLEVVLIILGSILLARFVAWVGRAITDRIDARATGGDALVRSEAAKHRHSLTQVLTWAAIVLIYSIAVFFVLDRLGVPVTGLVAPATVLGVGLGFGAQRIVGDVLAGFFIITERQYGFGDVVSISVTGARRAGHRHRRGRHAARDPDALAQRRGRHRAERRDRQGGQPLPRLGPRRRRRPGPDHASTSTGSTRSCARSAGEAFRDPALRPLLLDPPSVMGVESLDLEQVNVRMVARTLPGKQFEVGRDLRARVVLAFRDQGLSVPPPPPDDDRLEPADEPAREGEPMTEPTRRAAGGHRPTVTTGRPWAPCWSPDPRPPRPGPDVDRVLSVLFVAIGALYLNIRPDTPATATAGPAPRAGADRASRRRAAAATTTSSAPEPTTEDADADDDARQPTTSAVPTGRRRRRHRRPAAAATPQPRDLDVGRRPAADQPSPDRMTVGDRRPRERPPERPIGGMITRGGKITGRTRRRRCCRAQTSPDPPRDRRRAASPPPRSSLAACGGGSVELAPAGSSASSSRRCPASPPTRRWPPRCPPRSRPTA